MPETKVNQKKHTDKDKPIDGLRSISGNELPDEVKEKHGAKDFEQTDCECHPSSGVNSCNHRYVNPSYWASKKEYGDAILLSIKDPPD